MEVLILPEMIEAGVEALIEAEKSGAGERNTAILVYMAMRAVEELVLHRESETVH